MEFIKKNKFTIIAVAVFLVLILLAVQVKNILFPNVGNAVYGDRLKGISDVSVSSNDKSEIVKHLEEDESVSNVEVSVTGRIINITATVNDDIAVDIAKSLSAKSIEKLKSKQLKYFDVQLFLKKESESTNFPVIGYKHASKDNFSWTKDRE